ncbi:MAG: 2OG-Fe(II) oxygenase [Alphaproteobacteria bacterium]|nr:2OG-Fe(II) oxygenase [Alphaproteobacteria bacterium]MBT4710400.1 2OG-Fe(II) oxygenase [Alphaproteobacteria bacterium]MBT5860644.1 2OG-Fe(II) oxygenase [Alphaproteobacteria bacterium]
MDQIFADCLDRAEAHTEPYRHWVLTDALTSVAAHSIETLPIPVAAVEDTQGRRETHNESRNFFNPTNRRRFSVMDDVASMLQSPATVDRIERNCDIDLQGSYLRIEYCQDTDGFWLEPHTDIAEKLFTMLIYLSSDPKSSDWGTDIYDENLEHLGTAPNQFNGGLIFIPGKNTWHGFRKRALGGIRKAIIVNYVKDDWRARHELSYPDQPIA